MDISYLKKILLLSGKAASAQAWTHSVNTLERWQRVSASSAECEGATW